MKRFKIIYQGMVGMIAFIGLGTFTACEEEFYKDEQYRKEIYIVSGDDNIFGQEFTFDEQGSVGYLSVYAGGTTGIDSEVQVQLERDEEILREYNNRVEGEKYDDYALELSPEHYTIDNMTVTLSSDMDTPYSLCPVKVDINNLIPDEKYFIPLRIASVSDYMISEEKRSVLFQIYMKNDYATTKSDTYYNMTGVQQVGNNQPITITATKKVVPVSKYGVRILPASFATTDGREIRKRGIVVTVHPEELVDINVLNDEGLPSGEYVKMQKVTLESWIKEDASLTVEEMANEYGDVSYYDPEKKEYTLYYKYKLPEDADFTTMKEVMGLLDAEINNE